MSIDIDWDTLTAGPEGLELAENIRDFIHEKFQQVELPRFIRSVNVHSFDFGKECPLVELKDICDPLPDFYADDDHSDEVEDEEDRNSARDTDANAPEAEIDSMGAQARARNASANPSSIAAKRPQPIDPQSFSRPPKLPFSDHVLNSLRSGSSTPGIPGGTANLSYFHLPLSAGLSGSQTPLATAVGGSPYFAASPDISSPQPHHDPRAFSSGLASSSYGDPSSRPSTATSQGHIPDLSSPGGHRPTSSDAESQGGDNSPDPMDLQIVLHISYNGSVSLSMTAEILLDYPMPSFVGILLKLNIRGVSFDGVALIAYLRKRAHFCFLGPEDARTMVGMENVGADDKEGMGGLLREIQVESEIGRKEEGKQVLKNVGKVERFVLEQVRRIFEDEFVWPSFWTFLV